MEPPDDEEDATSLFSAAMKKNEATVTPDGSVVAAGKRGSSVGAVALTRMSCKQDGAFSHPAPESTFVAQAVEEATSFHDVCTLLARAVPDTRFFEREVAIASSKLEFLDDGTRSRTPVGRIDLVGWNAKRKRIVLCDVKTFSRAYYVRNYVKTIENVLQLEIYAKIFRKLSGLEPESELEMDLCVVGAVQPSGPVTFAYFESRESRLFETSWMERNAPFFRPVFFRSED